MKKHMLGKSGLEVPVLCFGGNVFGWTVDEQGSFALLDKCLSAGLTFIDTADVYSVWHEGNKGGESETIIGKWLKSRGNRDKLVIATKVGYDFGDGRKGLAKKYILNSVDESLRRLQTDYIDLYQAHKDDPDAPMEETMDAFAQLVKQGKVRALGASNFDAARLAQSLKVCEQNSFPRYESLQPNYNLYVREDFEAELEPLCKKEGIGVISYYSLASGFLTGKYRSRDDLSISARGSRVEKYMDERGFRILAALDKVSAEYKTTQAAVALAWLIARPSITAPIASATSTSQMNDLIASTELELSKDAINLLDEASAYTPKVREPV